MPSTPKVIAAPVGAIGAPRCLIVRQSVLSMHLKCSTPSVDRRDGPFGACLKGAGSPVAVIIGLLPGQVVVVQQQRQRFWRGPNLDPSFATQYRRIHFTRAFASAVVCPESRSEANRGAAAPEPEEWP